MIANIIIITIVTGIVTGIATYLIRAKRRGETCVGCPYGKQCTSNGKCTSHECSSNNNVEPPRT